DTIYNDSAKGSGVMQYCDGTTWIQLGGPNLPTSGLAGYWKFDETSGTSAADSSGTGNAGTTHNNPTWTTGKDAGALTFNGTSQYSTVAYAASLRIAGSWTVSTWVNPSALPASGHLGVLVNKDDSSAASNYGLSIDNGDIAAGLGWIINFNLAGGGANHYAKFVTSISTGQWYHVAGIYDSSAQTLSVYVNGVLGASASVAGFTPTSASGVPLSMGDEYVSGAPVAGGYFAGPLDDARLYSRALSAAEIWQLYAGTQ